MNFAFKIEEKEKEQEKESLFIPSTPQTRKLTLGESISNMELFNSDKNQKILLIGISGGQGSGKSKIAQELKSNIPFSALIEEKNYLKTLVMKRKISGGRDDSLVLDYDGYSKNRKLYLVESSNPNSYDHEKLYNNLISLKNGEKITQEKYDEETGSYDPEGETVIDPENVSIVIIEGCFVFKEKKIRDLLDNKIFIEIDDDIRLSRLIINENKHLKNNSLAFKTFFMIYEKYMKSSYERFIESNKIHAKIFLTNYAIKEDGSIQRDEIITLMIKKLSTQSKKIHSRKLKEKNKKEK